jgi:hypothetical protein
MTFVALRAPPACLGDYPNDDTTLRRNNGDG